MREDILIVDDEADIRLLIEGVLQDEGYATRSAGNSQTALRQVATRQPSLILLDIWLQNSQHDGLELLKILRRDYPVIQGVILMFSGVYVLINLLIDIIYTLLDPRIRY